MCLILGLKDNCLANLIYLSGNQLSGSFGFSPHIVLLSAAMGVFFLFLVWSGPLFLLCFVDTLPMRH